MLDTGEGKQTNIGIILSEQCSYPKELLYFWTTSSGVRSNGILKESSRKCETMACLTLQQKLKPPSC